MKKIISGSLFLLVLDQLIKILIINTIDLNTSKVIINNFFNITYVRNYGAAWSILTGNRLFLIVISILALLFIYMFMVRNKKLSKLENACYIVLIGGILGNFFDRIVYGYVVDYLDFTLFGYKYPIFNFADICIVISIIIIIYLTLKEGKNEKSRS